MGKSFNVRDGNGSDRISGHEIPEFPNGVMSESSLSTHSARFVM